MRGELSLSSMALNIHLMVTSRLSGLKVEQTKAAVENPLMLRTAMSSGSSLKLGTEQETGEEVC